MIILLFDNIKSTPVVVKCHNWHQQAYLPKLFGFVAKALGAFNVVNQNWMHSDFVSHRRSFVSLIFFSFPVFATWDELKSEVSSDVQSSLQNTYI